MAHIDSPAPMEYTHSFTQENINVAKRKKFGNQTARVEVTPFDPAYGVEHLLEVTFAEWKIAKEELEWNPLDKFKNFSLVLLGNEVLLGQNRHIDVRDRGSTDRRRLRSSTRHIH